MKYSITTLSRAKDQLTQAIKSLAFLIEKRKKHQHDGLKTFENNLKELEKQRDDHSDALDLLNSVSQFDQSQMKELFERIIEIQER